MTNSPDQPAASATAPSLPPTTPLTALLVAWRSGDGAAFDQVIEVAYQA